MNLTRCCLIFGIASVTAQEQRFHVQTRVVQVPVSVTTKNGRNVEGLVGRDFKVLVDGLPQPVTVDEFSAGSAPISLVIGIQSAGISAPALAKIRRIGGMIQPLITGTRGEAAVLTFDSEIQWRQEFTSESEKIQRTIKNLKPGPDMQARMFDAIAEAAERWKQRPGRRVLLLISESRDRGSQTGLQQAMDLAAQEDIQVFGAHYSAYATTWIAKPDDLPDPSASGGILAIITELARLGKTNSIQALTQATGGSDYPFAKERGIEKAIEKLGSEVHSQYILSFPQGQAAAGPHQIDVSVPDRAGVLIRFRRAYWAE